MLNRFLLAHRAVAKGTSAYLRPFTDLPMVMENLCYDLRLGRWHHDFAAVAVFGKSMPMKICHPNFGTSQFHPMEIYCT